MTFVSFNRPTFASGHRSWLTLHIPFKELQNASLPRVGAWLGKPRVKVRYKGRGGGMDNNNTFIPS